MSKKYDLEFKRNAVKLYFESGKSLINLGKDLNIPSSTLAGWINANQSDRNKTKGSILDEQATLSELKQLRKELMIVKEERDILKKAVAIFSEAKKR